MYRTKGPRSRISHLKRERETGYSTALSQLTLPWKLCVGVEEEVGCYDGQNRAERRGGGGGRWEPLNDIPVSTAYVHDSGLDRLRSIQITTRNQDCLFSLKKTWTETSVSYSAQK